jgi:TPR repeat protein
MQLEWLLSRGGTSIAAALIGLVGVLSIEAVLGMVVAPVYRNYVMQSQVAASSAAHIPAAQSPAVQLPAAEPTGQSPAAQSPVVQPLTDPDLGNAQAQNSLGLRYEKGQGVPQGYAVAARWYRKAADQRYANRPE